MPEETAIDLPEDMPQTIFLPELLSVASFSDEDANKLDSIFNLISGDGESPVIPLAFMGMDYYSGKAGVVMIPVRLNLLEDIVTKFKENS